MTARAETQTVSSLLSSDSHLVFRSLSLSLSPVLSKSHRLPRQLNMYSQLSAIFLAVLFPELVFGSCRIYPQETMAIPGKKGKYHYRAPEQQMDQILYFQFENIHLPLYLF